ncbi:ADP-ribosylation factor [Fimicolochytrium jonesii]|uniref:ADP-ribosylation factor n=1 Tax=Fimicolochytrium jonesii TaxID=1396493 RepID=UPI0022FDB52C|nr:ADP-ribosylation factor [Fimicolochytrium jonesii]KAI8818474.1 ADP-ribosylation factor [Fimicolochytrium jonesii]
MTATTCSTKWFFARSTPTCAAIVLGLDAAGKTTILYRLVRPNETVMTIPTIGFNVETVSVNGGTITLWDIGGCDQMRPLRRHYFGGMQGIVYVVDSADAGRVEEAGRELGGLAREVGEGEGSVPVVVLANKQDLPTALSLTEIQTALAPHIPPKTLWKVFPTTSTSPLTTDLDAPFHWLTTLITATSASPTTPPRTLPNHLQTLAEWLTRTDVPDAVFLTQLETFTLPNWDHYTHLRIAYVYLTTYGRQKGKDKIFASIETFIKNSGRTTAKTFSVTVTYFWLHMVDWALKTTPGASTSFHALLSLCPYLADGSLPLTYYTKERLYGSVESRTGFVVPDVRPLPNVVLSAK